MAAVYPGAVRSYTGKTDLVDLVLADHVNLLQDEVTAVETTLGTGILSASWTGTYNNNTSFDTLTARLQNIEAGLIHTDSSKQDASTAATLTGSQTLTNKTLTNPTINAAVISGSITSTATLTGGTVNPTTLQQGGVAAVTVSGSQTLTNKTLTAPAISGTGATFNGSTSGTTVLAATAAAGSTSLTLPAATDVLVARTTTDTLTNKTLSGSSNTFSNIPQASVTNLTTDLTAKAALAGATFTGNVSVVSPTATGSNGVRQITISTANPSGGSDGDIWITYV